MRGPRHAGRPRPARSRPSATEPVWGPGRARVPWRPVSSEAVVRRAPRRPRCPGSTRARRSCSTPATSAAARGRCGRVSAPCRRRRTSGSTSSVSPRGPTSSCDLRLESVVEGVLVSGTARVQRRRASACGCLDPISAERGGRPVQELYVYPEASASTDDERGRAARGRPARPRAGAARRGGARPAVRSRCAGTTARACAPSAGPGWRTTRSHRHEQDRPALGRPAGLTDPGDRDVPDRRPTTRKRADRGRPEAEDLAQQHPAPPFAVEGRRPGPRRPATAASSPKLPHTACPTCGTYDKRQVLSV